MPRSSASHPPEVVERYRELATRLLKERYNNNQAALARDLKIGAANINRFVIRREGGISSVTAGRLEAIATSEPTHTIPPPSRTPKIDNQDDELEKTIDFFQDRWPPDVVEVARLLVTHRGLRKDRNAWIEGLDCIEACVDDMIAKLK